MIQYMIQLNRWIFKKKNISSLILWFINCLNILYKCISYSFPSYTALLFVIIQDWMIFLHVLSDPSITKKKKEDTDYT